MRNKKKNLQTHAAKIRGAGNRVNIKTRWTLHLTPKSSREGKLTLLGIDRNETFYKYTAVDIGHVSESENVLNVEKRRDAAPALVAAGAKSDGCSWFMCAEVMGDGGG